MNFDFQYEPDPYVIEVFNEKYPAMIRIGNLAIRPFSLCVAIAALCALLLLWRTGRRVKLKKGTASTLAMLIIPLGLLFSRLFYVVDRWNWYEEIGFDWALRFWEGGYAMWGAVAGGVLAIWLASLIHREKASALFDACSAPAALFIALCRIGEFPFSGEGYGMEIVSGSFFFRFPLAVEMEEDYYRLAVFMLEGIAALIIMDALLRSRRSGGDKGRLFLILYSSAQIFFESLRRDQYLLLFSHEFIRADQLLAGVVMAGLIVAALLRRRRSQDSALSVGRIIALLVLFLAGIGIVIGMEFAKDKLPALPVWACYAIMAAACVPVGFAACRLVLPKAAGAAASRGDG